MEMNIYNQKISAIVDLRLNAIEESFEMFKTTIQNVGDLLPNILYDLKKYHPEAYSMHRDFMWNFIREYINNNQIKGIKEGYYRQDINSSVISTTYILMLMNVFENSDAFGKDANSAVLYKVIFNYHVSAIASDKGRKYLSEKYLNETLTSKK